MARHWGEDHIVGYAETFSESHYREYHVKKLQRKKPGAEELKRRAGNVKLVLTDNDGVLTDTGVYYSENGEAFKRFSIRDLIEPTRTGVSGRGQTCNFNMIPNTLSRDSVTAYR